MIKQSHVDASMWELHYSGNGPVEMSFDGAWAYQARFVQKDIWGLYFIWILESHMNSYVELKRSYGKTPGLTEKRQVLKRYWGQDVHIFKQRVDCRPSKKWANEKNCWKPDINFWFGALKYKMSFDKNQGEKLNKFSP